MKWLDKLLADERAAFVIFGFLLIAAAALAAVFVNGLRDLMIEMAK